MILHLVQDGIFIDMAYDMFEKASQNNNSFIVITNKKELKYIKTTPVVKITPSYLLSKKFINKLEKYEFVVLHVLDDYKKQLIINSMRNNTNIKFVWIGWGGDYYKYIKDNLLLENTDYLNKSINANKKKSIKNSLAKFKRYIINQLLLKDIDQTSQIFDRIDYFAPVLHDEYLLFLNRIQDFYPIYLDWNYGTLEDNFVKDKTITITGNNILLGNSMNSTSNHIDTIDFLKNLDLKNRKVITPLSYGGDIKYAQEVIRYGKKNLPDSFEPLTDFMNIDEYNKLISTCSVVIMNHLRQQALGNIISMLYFGAKVFLNKINPVYSFLINAGAIVYSMEELNSTTINSLLTKEEHEKNKKVLEAYWAKKVMIKKTKQLIKTVNEFKK